MKIALTNCWHDDNKGDSGIVWGTIESILHNYPNAQISLISTFSENDPRYENSFRHLQRRFPSVNVFGSPIERMDAYSPKIFSKRMNNFMRRCRWSAHLIRSLLTLLLTSILTRKLTNKPCLKAIHQSDLVISKGGHIFYATNFLDLFGILFHSYPLLLAWRFKKPFGIYAQSIGPFYNLVSRAFIKWLFSKAKFLLVRESISKQELIRCGIPEEKITIVPDAAFGLKPNLTERVKVLLETNGLIPNSFVVFTPRQWVFKTEFNRQKYLEGVAETADFVIENLSLKVALVSHTQGPIKIEDDRTAVEDIYKLLIKNKENTVIINEDLSPTELISLYSQSKFVVGTRFHSIIFSLIGKRPCIAISYSGPKAHGIMQMFGLEEFVVNIDEFKTEDCVKLIKIILDQYAKIQEKITVRLEKIQKEALITPKYIFGEVRPCAEL